MQIAIYGQKLKNKNVFYIKKLLQYAKAKIMNIFIEEKFCILLKKYYNVDRLKINTFKNYKDLSNNIKLIFAFGGDGTILNTITLIKNLNIPIVGINTGNLGFLSTFNEQSFVKNIDLIFNKKFHIIPRTLLWINTTKKIMPKKFLNFALNEITLLRRETVSMIKIYVFINNKFLTCYKADGLIIATPTGSTGYSLSCGGPIITPKCENFVLTPISPHNLFSRSIVIPDTEQLKLKIYSSNNNYSLSMDTRLIILKTSVEIYVKKANFNILIAQPKQKSYYQTLKEKLLWGFDKRNY
jgi:NAD+ kinase